VDAHPGRRVELVGPGRLLIGPTQTVFETDLQTGMSEQPGPGPRQSGHVIL
jgi:hypothetical protein